MSNTKHYCACFKNMKNSLIIDIDNQHTSHKKGHALKKL